MAFCRAVRFGGGRSGIAAYFYRGPEFAYILALPLAFLGGCDAWWR
jgi:hypothetical protein